MSSDVHTHIVVICCYSVTLFSPRLRAATLGPMPASLNLTERMQSQALTTCHAEKASNRHIRTTGKHTTKHQNTCRHTHTHTASNAQRMNTVKSCCMNSYKMHCVTLPFYKRDMTQCRKGWHVTCCCREDPGISNAHVTQLFFVARNQDCEYNLLLKQAQLQHSGLTWKRNRHGLSIEKERIEPHRTTIIPGRLHTV